MYNQGGDPDSVAGEFGIHPLYKMLGYFSLIGLLRLHSLLGDYFQAIKVLENVELNKKVIKVVKWSAILIISTPPPPLKYFQNKPEMQKKNKK